MQVRYLKRENRSQVQTDLSKDAVLKRDSCLTRIFSVYFICFQVFSEWVHCGLQGKSIHMQGTDPKEKSGMFTFMRIITFYMYFPGRPLTKYTMFVKELEQQHMKTFYNSQMICYICLGKSTFRGQKGEAEQNNGD